jgi:DNA-binding Lrp family transcriptional regulator
MLPVEHDDPINAKILAISEDKIEGFVREPFEEIAKRCGVDVDLVMARIAAMLRAGTIRRVRQTLLATNLADGALVAWKVTPEKIDNAFDWMFQRDPFSGHVVLRSTDTVSAGSDYKLWTTVKVPHGFSLQQHCELLSKKVDAKHFRLMPAKGIFTLGVGHVRRKTIAPGSKADQPAKMIPVQVVELGDLEWKFCSRSSVNLLRKKFDQHPGLPAQRKLVSRWMNFIAWPKSWTRGKSLDASQLSWNMSNRRLVGFVSPDSMHFFTGRSRRVVRSRRAARSGGITF